MLLGIYSLSNRPDLARQRQLKVINDMEQYGYLTKTEKNNLLEEIKDDL